MLETKTLIIFDKDGTLTIPKSGKQFVQHPEDQKLLPNVLNHLKDYTNKGFILGIASNQYSVGAGYKTLDNCILEMMFLIQLLENEGVQINKFTICPDIQGQDCMLVNNGGYLNLMKDAYTILVDENKIPKVDLELLKLKGKFRKPNPGMLNAIVLLNKNRFYFDRKIMIGNMESDRKAAKNAEFKYFDATDWREGKVRL